VKKLFYIPLIMLALCLGCGSDTDSERSASPSTTKVTIKLGGLPAEKLSAQSIPSTITEIVITVSGDGIDTITRSIEVSDQSSITATLDVPNGSGRKFDVAAKDHSGTVLYRGTETKDLEGTPLALDITLIGNSPPTADAGPDQNVDYFVTVFLNGSGSSDADADALSYSWSMISIPSFSNVTLDFPVAVDPSFFADMEGDYVISLTVDDGWGGSSTDTVIINSTMPLP
jgi:hypothetical protein